MQLWYIFFQLLKPHFTPPPAPFHAATNKNDASKFRKHDRDLLVSGIVGIVSELMGDSSISIAEDSYGNVVKKKVSEQMRKLKANFTMFLLA